MRHLQNLKQNLHWLLCMNRCWYSLIRMLSLCFKVDLGNIIAIHGIGTQGHGGKEAYVTKFKIQISLDAISFVTLMDTGSDKELVSQLNYKTGTFTFGLDDKLHVHLIVHFSFSWETKINTP